MTHEPNRVGTDRGPPGSLRACVSAMDWDPGAARLGLQELRRLRGELAAVEAVLVGVLKTETGRDTKATLACAFAMSDAEARKAEQVADVVGRVPPAIETLMAGGTVNVGLGQ